MTNALLCALVLVLQGEPAEQKAARERAVEMRRECAEALKGVDGVGSVGLGGTGTDYRLVIAVRDTEALRAVRDLVGGDTYGGVRIVWSVSEAPRTAAPPPGQAPDAAPPPQPPPQDRVRPPEPYADRNNFWNASVTDCDIIRDHLKLKPVTHPAGNGKSWVPCQVIQRTTIGPDGGHSFTYTKHRPDCPVRMGRVSEPGWSDNYMAWVFRSGMTAPTGTNFTIPGNGWTWAAQTAADMASRLPQVREGAGAGPSWVWGYGWVYPYAPSYYYYRPYYYYHPYRYWSYWPCRPWYWHHHWCR